MSSFLSSVALKRVRPLEPVSSVEVVDLCSPLPTKPCRQTTPILTTTEINYASLSVSRLDQNGKNNNLDSKYGEEVDEYWEPAQYREDKEQISPQCKMQTPVNGNDNGKTIGDDFSSEEIIDLCSPPQVELLISSCSSSPERSSHNGLQPQSAAAIDLTQRSESFDSVSKSTSGEEEEFDQEYSFFSKVNVNFTSQSTKSFFAQATAGPTLGKISTTGTSLHQMLQSTENSALSMRSNDISTASQVLVGESHRSATTNPCSTSTATSTFTSTVNQIPRSGINDKYLKPVGQRKALERAGSVPTVSVTVQEQLQVSTKTVCLSKSGNNYGTSTSVATDTAFRSRYADKTLVSLTPNSSSDWEVVMLIDKRERSNAQIEAKMSSQCIPCHLSTLAVGDFMWVVRPKAVTATTGASSSSSGGSSNRAGSSREEEEKGDPYGEDTQMSTAALLESDESFDVSTAYVLDCVAERKSINDLVSSFSDGRYVEQKNRLKACNLRSTMYIVEGEHIVVSNHQKAISAAHIKTAMVSIQVDSGMHVLRTRSIDHTITCLQNLHRQVERRFQQVHSVNSTYQPFAEFQAMYGKKSASTFRQLFGHQLRQIHGCSTAIAATLIDRFGTTARFMQEIDCMGQVRAEYMLSNMVNSVTGRKFGPKLAKRLWQVYMAEY